MSDQPHEDHSEAPEVAPRGSLQVWTGPEVPADLAGCVQAIAPPAEPGHGTRIDLRDAAGEIQSFFIRIPDPIVLPFTVGDDLVVRTASAVLGIHLVQHAMVATADGELLIGQSGDGDASYAPGWSVDVRSIARGPTQPGSGGGIAARIDLWVVLGHQGRTARVTANAWRRLATPDGSWWVSGNAQGWEPGKPIPPDASTYHAYTVVRERPSGQG